MDAPITVCVGQEDVIHVQSGSWLNGQQGVVADEIFRKTYQKI